MHKTLMSTTGLLAAGIMLAGSVLAQQAPASTSTGSSATKTSTSSTAKTHTATTAKKSAAAPLVLKTNKEKASYAIGMSIGKKLHDDQMDVDTAILVRALKDALAGNKLLMTDDELRAALIQFQQDMRKEMIAKNLKEGDAYRATNKAKPGVVTLPDGLQYKILTEGNGPKPTAGDSVVCNYKGTFVDGKEFDSSYKRGEPATFPVTGVIKGWTEALQMMPVGSKWQLVIPPDLAYGEQGRPGMPPNSTLVFEVELVKIAPKPPETPAPQAPSASQPEGTQPSQAKPAESSQPQAAQPKSSDQTAAPQPNKPQH